MRFLYLHGLLAQFTYIENSKWFNLSKLDFDEEFKIPEGLFPDAVLTEYVFIPKAHRFCFRTTQSISISPYPVKNFLQFALDEVAKQNEFIEVDVETSKFAIDKILAAKVVKSIDIDINISNFDITDDLQKFVEDDMKNSDTGRLQVGAKQKKGRSIIIKESKILSGALSLSQSNGEATAKIINENNRTETIKTSKFPLVERIITTLSQFNDNVFEKIMQIFRNKDK